MPETGPNQLAFKATQKPLYTMANLDCSRVHTNNYEDKYLTIQS